MITGKGYSNSDGRALFLLMMMAGIFFLSNGAISQGCSDAGFCTIGANQTFPLQKVSKNTLSFNTTLGVGDDQVLVFTPAVSYKYSLSEYGWLEAKLTANYASGNLGKVWGAGDLFLSGSRLFILSGKWKGAITAGIKLPLNQANLRENGLPLPMQYQASLGTVDALLGLSVSTGRVQFAAGWQQPMSGINRNNFLPAYWQNIKARQYPPSNDLGRKGDVLFRAFSTIIEKKKWELNAGILAVYHLGKDTYVDANVSNDKVSLEGSQGATVNLTGGAKFSISNSVTFQIIVGSPVITRTIRPDGLTRSIVFSPEIIFKL